MVDDFLIDGRRVGRNTPDGAAIAHLAKAFAEAHAMTNQSQDMALSLVVTLLANVLACGPMTEAQVDRWLRNLRKQLPHYIGAMRTDGAAALTARMNAGTVGRA